MTGSPEPEFEFYTSSACTYENNNPRCVEFGQNAEKVAVRNSVTGETVKFTREEWSDFLAGAKLGEFDLSA
ncbi:DUF397 domain-containing protein [Streptomyces sp. NBC_00291]|uniref:DUF397 domain-containing protein n=1 Tax=Streptomyces sp. NBC_00291 TaxID=2975704 RepID=UPI002252E23B|nr:DUF397 domain-containing protein [Streptomyces sp. NBC_00291]MCX5153727.1 DUF397 domain-containing protein [Streptomyces sp. NBC_00291]